ncbi:hypothetical protein WJX73_001588 [Symbiochloris irregularis]|uniref:Gfo/Idh/MocA-like oxidoreductase N-terminal domain-containing protein n=1 Tax=Symbiochloris irregularis TaxID=706552 RepID=A0AAW1NZC8_9CHLO
MSTDALHLGILSAATIAHKNVRAILKTPAVEVVAVASKTPDKAETLIKDFGLEGKAKAYGSYEQLLDDPNVHAVYIPLPAGLRPEWVCKAAAKGKHVVGEKPVALSVKETDELVAACKKHGVQYMDGSMWLHNPRTAEMRKVIDSQIGTPRTVITTLSLPVEDIPGFQEASIRCHKHLDGLGALGDLGWYNVAVSLWAFNYDKPIQVQAHIGPKFCDGGTLMRCGANLLWEDGRRASLSLGYDRGLTQYAQVCGTEGVLEWNDYGIPHREDKAEYTVKNAGMFIDLYTKVGQDIETKQVNLEQPQEVHMWENFAKQVLSKMSPH